MIIKDDATRLMFETLTLFLSSILHVSPLLSFFVLLFWRLISGNWIKLVFSISQNKIDTVYQFFDFDDNYTIWDLKVKIK